MQSPFWCLEKYSVYEIKVSASTNAGEGENTTAEEFRTDEDSKFWYLFWAK